MKAAIIMSSLSVTDPEAVQALHQTSKPELIRMCRRTNTELEKQKLYLDQLLTIVIECNPEILDKVTQAQKQRCSLP